ncbi:Sporulation-specific extracellular nuclease precursor [compost metagenome]
MFRWIVMLLATVLLAGCSVQQQEVARPSKTEPVAAPVTQVSADKVTLEFPSDRYPETAQHIKGAIAAGHSNTCTIDRDGADSNPLQGVSTKKGKDRDEWPMAM